MKCRDFRPGILFTLLERGGYERQSTGLQAEVRRLYRHQTYCVDCGKIYQDLVPEFSKYAADIGLEIVAENVGMLDRLMQEEKSTVVRLRRELVDILRQNVRL